MKTSCPFQMAAALVALVVMSCGDPPSLVGQPCQTDDHCGTEAGLDLTCDHAVPGGYCTLAGCDPDAPSGCPQGSLCVTEADTTACRLLCETVLDCREVMACGPDPDCDPALETCHQVCANAMRCVPVPGVPEGESEQATCQFSPP